MRTSAPRVRGLLADVLAQIVTGRRVSITNYAPDREELRKRITALVLEGERLARGGQ